MADRGPAQRDATNGSSFLRTIRARAPNSTQLVGLLTLLITVSILLLLTGIAFTVSFIGLIFFTPLIVFSSPIWVPVGTVLFLAIAGFLSFCGFAVASAGGLSWLFSYFRGNHPPGSDRLDYARSRIYHTATHVNDYAREYGGYLRRKVKDAAPGA